LKYILYFLYFIFLILIQVTLNCTEILTGSLHDGHTLNTVQKSAVSTVSWAK